MAPQLDRHTNPLPATGAPGLTGVGHTFHPVCRHILCVALSPEMPLPSPGISDMVPVHAEHEQPLQVGAGGDDRPIEEWAYLNPK